MRIYILFHLLLLLVTSQLSAQNQDSIAIKKYYEENTILWLGGTKYFKNYKSFPLRQLKTEIKFSPDAIYEFAQYRRKRKLLVGGIITSEVLLLTSILAKNQEVRVVAFAGSLVALSISLPLSSKTWAHLSRSIWLHNRDVLLR